MPMVYTFPQTVAWLSCGCEGPFVPYSIVKPRVPEPSATAGVYADLDALVRLQFQARGFSFLPHQPVHSLLAGRHASRLRGRGLNFEEIRHYLPGDDIRNMDWHVTARMRQPYIRVYTEERDRPVLLLVDQRRSMFLGRQRAVKSVVAAEATALAAWRVRQAGDRVGAMVFDDQEVVEIPPQRAARAAHPPSGAAKKPGTACGPQAPAEFRHAQPRARTCHPNRPARSPRLPDR